jgi:hypothetical protein
VRRQLNRLGAESAQSWEENQERIVLARDSGLTLPAGFCATVFADGVGHARHLVVAPSGVVYVNTWSGDYYHFDQPRDGGFLVALEDKTGAGKADVIERFGETVQTGGAGGTGIGLYKGAIYAEINDRIVRYALPADSIVLPAQGLHQEGDKQHVLIRAIEIHQPYSRPGRPRDPRLL